MYAKLVNGVFRRAPNKIKYNGKTHINPKEDILLESGYLPVVHTDMPTNALEGKHYESSWQQTDAEILQVWTLVEDPVIPEEELSADEALAIIMGVAE